MLETTLLMKTIAFETDLPIYEIKFKTTFFCLNIITETLYLGADIGASLYSKMVYCNNAQGPVLTT